MIEKARDGVTRRHFLLLPAALAVWPLAASASDRRPEHLCIDDKGIALGGFDPMSYWQGGGPQRGARKHEATLEGARFWFASEATKAAFLADPQRYLPQYGGFCAFGVSHGKKYPGNPLIFQIFGDRLFVEYDRAAKAVWEKGIERNIAIADRIWPKIQAIPAGTLN